MSAPKYIQEFGKHFASDEQVNIKFFQYQLLTNYRSRTAIVDLFTQFSGTIDLRLKTKPLQAHRKSLGNVSLTYYEQDSNYYDNILESIQNNESNNIAVLARNNQEVLSIYSMLISHKIKARYIMDNHGFSLGNILELQDFLQDWKATKDFEKSRKNSDKKYQKSANNLLKNQVIDRFSDEHQQEIGKSQAHFISIFEQYLSNIEFDEFKQSQTKVVVSTIHKAKGKEWSDVYLCIDEQFSRKILAEKRLVYVAITRAKNNLYIHSKTPLFNQFIQPIICNTPCKKLEIIVLLMGLKDVALSNEYSKIGIERSQPMAGEEVQIKDNSHIHIIKNGHQISSLSKAMINEIRKHQDDGYVLQKAEVENIIIWKNKKNGEMLKQVLCKIYLVISPTNLK